MTTCGQTTPSGVKTPSQGPCRGPLQPGQGASPTLGAPAAQRLRLPVAASAAPGAERGVQVALANSLLAPWHLGGM